MISLYNDDDDDIPTLSSNGDVRPTLSTAIGMNAVYLCHIYMLTDPLVKLQIQKKAEVLHAAVKRKMIVKEYYTMDSDSDNNWVGYV